MKKSSKKRTNYNKFTPREIFPHYYLKSNIPEIIEEEPINMPSECNCWSFEGKPYKKLVTISNNDIPMVKKCYPAIRHHEGVFIQERDCVLLKSGYCENDLPYIAKIISLYENSEGKMMASLLWYYRPEETKIENLVYDENEIFASKHKDTNEIRCIDGKCYVLTFSEYCRYRGIKKRIEDGLPGRHTMAPSSIDGYPRERRFTMENSVATDLVFFCHRAFN